MLPLAVEDQTFLLFLGCYQKYVILFLQQMSGPKIFLGMTDNDFW